ncbi:glycerophosphodiester phosphodiesterase [Cohnella terricola]|uniref:Glycerophosphodiester phosphodiesterase n=1 Tax=Cohnella terricola TaxID=1289167 RepID=A0A559JTA5_9BACL|nr:glycerophosphodiester phosphodiesterase [Cohnella terricola]TVY03101.1 glycerophosphodiester phosphodiesterase [Cohnella terricola]
MNHRSFPLTCAHTGCGTAPDNTMASFMDGISMGANVVEVDLRATKDGTVVLMHDHSPLLHEMSFEQLNQLENRMEINPAYEFHNIASLDEIVDKARTHGIKLNLDIKTEATIQPAIQSIQRSEAEDLVFITGCSNGITDSYSGIKVLYNTPDDLTNDEEREYASWSRAISERAHAGGYFGLNMDYRTCRREVVEEAHALGLAVWVYTVDDEEAICNMIEIGVDEITTNNVTLLKQLQAQRG